MQLGKTPKIFGLADLAVGRVIREGFRPSSGSGRADGPEPTSAAPVSGSLSASSAPSALPALSAQRSDAGSELLTS